MRQNIASQHSNLKELGKIISQWSSVPANSQLIAFFKKLDALMIQDTAKLKNMDYLSSYCKYRPSGTPSLDATAELNALIERYPLLFKTTESIGVSCLNNADWAQACSDYVLMVDTLTP